MSDETIRPTEPTPEEGDNQEVKQENVSVPEAGEQAGELTAESTEETPDETAGAATEPTEDTPDETIEAPTEASAAAQAESAPEDTASESSSEITPPVTTYRWTYAEQSEHDRMAASRGRRGVLVYAFVMTGVFLVSIGLLVAVILMNGGFGNAATGILRPGISQPDDEAVEGVEQAKHSVVVLEVTTATGGSTGTGIVMTADGYIATNHHVIDNATFIKVRFYDGTVTEATVVGSSEMDDLAVIKVERVGLIPATFAHSENCYVGQTVYAIGTPAGPDFAFTTTRGIISYKDREVKIYDETDGTLQKKLRLLQTDANVNPGNSGGPLINTDGHVVGVVSMKLAQGYEGIGFAIPSDGAVEILEAIMEHGNADNINSSLSHKRPILGITAIYLKADTYYYMADGSALPVEEDEIGNYPAENILHPAKDGVHVISVTAGLGADGKLFPGDIVTAVQGEMFTSLQGMMAIINQYYAGNTITLTVYRNNAFIPVDITLSAQEN